MTSFYIKKFSDLFLLTKKILAFGYGLESGEVKIKFNLSSVKLHPKPSVNVMAPCVYKFLGSLFRAIDVEKQGFISQNSVQQIFQACEKVPHEFDFNLPTTPIGKKHCFS